MILGHFVPYLSVALVKCKAISFIRLIIFMINKDLSFCPIPTYKEVDLKPANFILAFHFFNILPLYFQPIFDLLTKCSGHFFAFWLCRFSRKPSCLAVVAAAEEADAVVHPHVPHHAHHHAHPHARLLHHPHAAVDAEEDAAVAEAVDAVAVEAVAQSSLTAEAAVVAVMEVAVVVRFF
jgi:hypothetical protein